MGNNSPVLMMGTSLDAVPATITTPSAATLKQNEMQLE
jgi:hypothetical protein